MNDGIPTKEADNITVQLICKGGFKLMDFWIKC